MKIFVIGIRGFPDVQGGVETHAENLYPQISGLNVSVTCATRTPFHDKQIRNWKGVRMLSIWSPRSKYFETIVHSLLATVRAAISRPDVVHIHAVGPALVTPLVRLFGLRAVVTHHGPDYDREKWNSFAKWILRLGERVGMTFANRRITISQVIADLVRDRYGLDSAVIPNGVPIPQLDADKSVLDRFQLQSRRYVIHVSRFVPEKRHLDLIKAFQRADLNNWKLVLVGDADHPDEYLKLLREEASRVSNIVLTGFQSGESLKTLYQFAGIFVLPSSHEGLPISLLEALSYGLPCLASSIPANRSVGLESQSYFELGNIEALARKLRQVAKSRWSDEDRDKVRSWIAMEYDWRTIAGETIEVYREAAS